MLFLSLYLFGFILALVRGQMPSPTAPLRWGLLLFDSFESLDVIGPLECLNLASGGPYPNLTLTFITADEDRAKEIKSSGGPFFTESFGIVQSIEQVRPGDLDVLLTPGAIVLACYLIF